jgi:hypothetical protein
MNKTIIIQITTKNKFFFFALVQRKNVKNKH